MCITECICSDRSIIWSNNKKKKKFIVAPIISRYEEDIKNRSFKRFSAKTLIRGFNVCPYHEYCVIVDHDAMLSLTIIAVVYYIITWIII